MPESLILFGGQFDPFHHGHAHVVTCMLQTNLSNRVVIIPSGEPPHRNPGIATLDHRMAMIQLAISDTVGVTVSDYEGYDRPSWTVRTLQAFQQFYPEARLYWAIGSDNYNRLHTWKQYQQLFRLATLCVINRTGSGRNPYLSDQDHQSIITLQTVAYPMAAEQIRAHCRQGDYNAVRTRVHPAVMQYIKANQLFI